MKVLGIETATETGGVALVDETGLLGEIRFRPPAPAHGELLMAAVDRLLSDVGETINSVEGIAVSIGPGLFTGLRVGIATAKGLALGRRIPAIGVPTLFAMAAGLPYASDPIVPMIDVRKGEVAFAIYAGPEGAPVLLETAAPPAQAARLLSERAERMILFGSGFQRYQPIFREALGRNLLEIPAIHSSPSAAAVAQIGRRRLLAGERPLLQPIYLRPQGVG